MFFVHSGYVVILEVFPVIEKCFYMLVSYVYFFLIQKIILISIFGIMINSTWPILLCDAQEKESLASSA